MRVLFLLVSALAAAACFNVNGSMNESLPMAVENNFAVVEYAPPTTAPPTTSAPPSSSSSSAPPSSSSGSTSTGGSSSSGSSSSGSGSSSASEAQDFPRLYKLRSSHRRL